MKIIKINSANYEQRKLCSNFMYDFSQKNPKPFIYDDNFICQPGQYLGFDYFDIYFQNGKEHDVFLFIEEDLKKEEKVIAFFASSLIDNDISEKYYFVKQLQFDQNIESADKKFVEQHLKKYFWKNSLKTHKIIFYKHYEKEILPLLPFFIKPKEKNFNLYFLDKHQLNQMNNEDFKKLKNHIILCNEFKVDTYLKNPEHNNIKYNNTYNTYNNSPEPLFRVIDIKNNHINNNNPNENLTNLKKGPQYLIDDSQLYEKLDNKLDVKVDVNLDNQPNIKNLNNLNFKQQHKKTFFYLTHIDNARELNYPKIIKITDIEEEKLIFITEQELNFEKQNTKNITLMTNIKNVSLKNYYIYDF